MGPTPTEGTMNNDNITIEDYKQAYRVIKHMLCSCKTGNKNALTAVKNELANYIADESITH